MKAPIPSPLAEIRTELRNRSFHAKIRPMLEKVVFMGSPQFAIPTLTALTDAYTVQGVITQPDKPAGRGRKPFAPPVKVLAEDLGLHVLQPHSLKEPEVIRTLQDWNPDLIVVAAFGQILREEVLNIPRFGCLNVHASLLPRWRGASPVQYAILEGDPETGVTIMKMDPGLDTGPILNQRSILLTAAETAGILTPKLAQLGAILLLETIPRYLEGVLTPAPQDDALATYAPRLKKADGKLDFKEPAEALARRIRAFDPWPGTFMDWNGKFLKVYKAHVVPGEASPGQTAIHQKLPAVGTANGWLILEEVQMPGKKRIPGHVFLNGARQWSRNNV